MRRIFKSIIITVFCFGGVIQTQAEISKGKFTVVIDAGHGGHDAGAVDNNEKEKDINLGVANGLANLIRSNMNDVKVVQTRSDDKYLSLQERAAIANNNKGDLFISIHTNSIDASNPQRRSIAGASVYALGLHKDKSNLQVAMRENSVIELEHNYTQKYSGFDPSKDESYIIFEMAQKKNLTQSLKFASMAQQHLVKDANRRDRGVKQAGFWVLWATSMPAVLIELDFICNPESAEFIGSEEGQKKMALALYNAFSEYINQSQVLTSVSLPKSPSRTDKIPSIVSSSDTATKRRRRSDSSKKISDERVVATDNIPIHSEKEYMAKKVVNKISNKEGDGESETRHATLNLNTKEVEKRSKSARIAANREATEKSGYRPKLQRFKTVYKIQLLASLDKIPSNSSRFCGLTPISEFKEDNYYKYTYYESTNRKELETILKEVKNKFPDAFIISGKKEIK